MRSTRLPRLVTQCSLVETKFLGQTRAAARIFSCLTIHRDRKTLRFAVPCIWRNSVVKYDNAWYYFVNKSWQLISSPSHFNRTHLHAQLNLQPDGSDLFLEYTESNLADDHLEMLTILGEMTSLLETSNTRSVSDYVHTVRNIFNLPSANQLFPSFRKFLKIVPLVLVTFGCGNLGLY